MTEIIMIYRQVVLFYNQRFPMCHRATLAFNVFCLVQSRAYNSTMGYSRKKSNKEAKFPWGFLKKYVRNQHPAATLLPPLLRENPQLQQLTYLRYIHLVQDIYFLFRLYIYPNQSIPSPQEMMCYLQEIQLASYKNMVNIPENKVKVAHEIVGNIFLAKGFFVIMDV